MTQSAPPTVGGFLAWLMRGRMSSLRGLAAVGFCVATLVGPWPLVLYWCHTRGRRYAASVLVSLLTWPVMLWSLLLHGWNAPVELSPYDPNRPQWWTRRPFPKPGSALWGKLNQERARLIRMKVRGEPMTEGQRLRLAYLQEQTRAALGG